METTLPPCLHSHSKPIGPLRIVHCITLTLNFTQENRFTKCDTCCMLKDEKEKTNDANRKAQLRQMLDDHLALQA
jgi:hypothetical protein